VPGFDGDLFGYFARDGGAIHFAKVRIEQGDFIIDGVYVATYADGAQLYEASLSGAFAADLGEVLVVAAHDHVGDKLFIVRVGFGL
jgi:hypothetical protein